MVLSKIFVLNNFVTLHSMFDPGIRGALMRVRPQHTRGAYACSMFILNSSLNFARNYPGVSRILNYQVKRKIPLTPFKKGDLRSPP